MIRKNKISFIGLGKLGLPLATTFAKGGVEVMGIDKNKTLINLLSNGELPFYETGLRTNLNDAKRSINILRPEYLNVFLENFEEIMEYKPSNQFVSASLKKTENPRLISP